MSLQFQESFTRTTAHLGLGSAFGGVMQRKEPWAGHMFCRWPIGCILPTPFSVRTFREALEQAHLSRTNYQLDTTDDMAFRGTPRGGRGGGFGGRGGFTPRGGA
jgi:hypothetical protein